MQILIHPTHHCHGNTEDRKNERFGRAHPKRTMEKTTPSVNNVVWCVLGKCLRHGKFYLSLFLSLPLARFFCIHNFRIFYLLMPSSAYLIRICHVLSKCSVSVAKRRRMPLFRSCSQHRSDTQVGFDGIHNSKTNSNGTGSEQQSFRIQFVANAS